MYKIIILSVIAVFVWTEDVNTNNGVMQTDATETVGKADRVVEESQDEPEVSNDPVVYDAYFGKPLTTKRQVFLSNVVNGSALCTVVVRPCRKYEGRRVDGTCTNPKYPSRGATLSPLPRLLPANFGPGSSLRPGKDGSELPSSRLLRTTLLGVGYFRDHDFSILATHIFVFSFADNYNRVPPLLDLSVIYGNTEDRNKQIRLNQGGLLAFRMEGNREVPAGNSVFCIGNQPPETSCYNYGDDYDANLVPGTYLTAMWFFREHNRIARELAIINPCWEDEKLFQIARVVNIAQWQSIFYYELIAELLGRKNALADGIIYDTYDHVNDFDPDYEPGTYREYVVGSRWFHTFQPTLFDMYRNGKYYGSRPTVEDGFRSGILAQNNTEADMTQGAFIQPADRFDMIIDPDLAERMLGEFHRSSDVVAIDIMRGRDAGLPPYNEYRKFCGFKVAKKFEDFQDTIDKDKVEMLRRIYDDVEDVELMVAIYVERLLPGAYVGPSLYCIMAHNLLLWRKSDKYFFEHGDTPAALTNEQLYEVRQTSMARILCDSGDDVTKIQPRALLRKGPWNDFVSCNEIPGLDLNKWKDQMCSADKPYQN